MLSSGRMKKIKKLWPILIVCLLAVFYFAYDGQGFAYAAIEKIKMVVSTPKEPERQKEIDRSVMKTMEGTSPVDILSVEEPEDGTNLPANIKFNLKYTQNKLSYQYVLAKKKDVHVRSAPSTESSSLKKTYIYERFEYIETIQSLGTNGKPGDKWVHVAWDENENKKFGFIHKDMTITRTFAFEKMYNAVIKAEKDFAKGKVSYINNYKDMTGKAPLYKGNEIDSFGTPRAQSAPGYEKPDPAGEFFYIEDGSLLNILGKENGLYKVRAFKTGKTCYVPEKYVPAWKKIGPLLKVIVIDVKSQNEVLFEKTDDGWVIVSYSLATTGVNAKYKSATTLGSYYVIEKRDKFDYLDDITKEVTGYAPYAVRFNGGAYIHGVPVSSKFENGKRIDPGMVESSKTLGTIPLSHKCVRNFTSHAKFVRDWSDLGKTAVLVVD